MKELESRELGKFISNVKDLEVVCYKQRCYISYLNNLINQLSHPNLIPAIKTQNKKKLGEIIADFIAGCLAYGLLWGGSAIIGVLAGLVVGVILAIIIEIISGVEVLGTKRLLVAPALGGIIGFVVRLIIDIKESIQDKRRNETAKIQNAANAKQNMETLDRCRKQKILVIKELDKAKSKLSEMQKVLGSYYSTNVIYQKYRGLIPITMFCEYFASGRCSTLTGHEGAYNIYENEVRLNMIITKLDDVLDRLDEIRGNQYMLAQSIQESNREISNLSASVNRQIGMLANIEDSSAQSAYYNRITATCTAYSAWLASR